MWAILREPCDENVIRSAPERSTYTKARGRWILAASMAFIDGTVVDAALLLSESAR
jgi:hypothetical protein